MRRWPFVTAVGLVTTGCMGIVYLLLNWSEKWWMAILASAAYFGAAVVSFVVYKIEDRTEYYQEENEDMFDYGYHCN